jgi:hypothetical protein
MLLLVGWFISFHYFLAFHFSITNEDSGYFLAFAKPPPAMADTMAAIGTSINEKDDDDDTLLRALIKSLADVNSNMENVRKRLH